VPIRHALGGAIISTGMASGDRFVVGRWRTTPIGPMTDVMWARPDGERVLLAPSEAAARFITAVYAFDRVVVTPFEVDAGPRSLSVAAADLTLRLEAGRGVRIPATWRPPWVTRFVEGPVAAVVLGVRTHGRSPTGVHEWYRADRWSPLASASATLAGRSLGAMAPVRPPVGVGFSEPPSRPSWVDVRPLLLDPSGHLDAVLDQLARERR
jgi:hypothetical protein